MARVVRKLSSKSLGLGTTGIQEKEPPLGDPEGGPPSWVLCLWVEWWPVRATSPWNLLRTREKGASFGLIRWTVSLLGPCLWVTGTLPSTERGGVVQPESSFREV